MHLASFEGSLNCARWLLDQGADPLKRDIDGRTPKQLCHGDKMKLVFNLKEQASVWHRSHLDSKDAPFGIIGVESKKLAASQVASRKEGTIDSAEKDNE